MSLSLTVDYIADQGPGYPWEVTVHAEGTATGGPYTLSVIGENGTVFTNAATGDGPQPQPPQGLENFPVNYIPKRTTEEWIKFIVENGSKTANAILWFYHDIANAMLTQQPH